MKANEQRAICGIVQNKIFEITGVFGSATSTGYSLFFKITDIERLKKLNLPLMRINNQYMLMIGKRVEKLLFIK